MDNNLVSGFELQHLSHVKSESLMQYVQQLKQTLSKDLNDKKLIVVLGTGGTISMVEDAGGTLVPDLDFKSILARNTLGFDTDFIIDGFDLFAIDSSQMDYTHVKDITICASYIWKNLKEYITGFLVLHGTDTMAYSASALSLMMGHGLPFPVVFTGAQKPIVSPITDAVKNLQNALYTLQALYNNDMAEVVIVMGDIAMLGSSAVKVNDTEVNAFDTPFHKYVARFNRLDYPVKLASWLKKKRDVVFTPYVWKSPFSQTLIVRQHLGLSPETVAQQLQDERIKAVILYSYGGNTVHEDVVNAIMPIADRRALPVFVVSPVNAEIKSIYASAYHMIERGVVPLFITLPTALAKIEIALRLYNGERSQICNFMTQNYVGEIPDGQSRYIAEK